MLQLPFSYAFQCIQQRTTNQRCTNESSNVAECGRWNILRFSFGIHVWHFVLHAIQYLYTDIRYLQSVSSSSIRLHFSMLFSLSFWSLVRNKSGANKTCLLQINFVLSKIVVVISLLFLDKTNLIRFSFRPSNLRQLLGNYSSQSWCECIARVRRLRLVISFFAFHFICRFIHL